MLAEIRHAVRGLRKSRGPTLVAVLTIGLAVGANTAIFSFLRATVLRPLPYADADRMVFIGDTWPNFTGPRPISPVDYRDWVAQNTAFEQMAAGSRLNGDVTLSDAHGVPAYLAGLRVSASYFDVFGFHAALGRTFTADDERVGARVVILSHRLWTTQFGSDPGIIGRAIRLDADLYTVIGVMPSGISLDLSEPELWRPLTVDPALPRNERNGWAIGKLKRGVTLAQARRQMNQIAQRLAQAYPESNTGYGVTLEPLSRPVNGDAKSAAYLLFAAVGVVLIIACTNLANLALGRSVTRARELSIRAALGASRWQLARLILFEQVALGLGGGAVGMLLAGGLVAILRARLPVSGIHVVVPPDTTVSIDTVVWLFAFALSLCSGVACGLVPAFRSTRFALPDALKTGGGPTVSASGRYRLLQQGLVVGEVALAFVLLAAAGLLLQSFADLTRRVSVGFDATRVLTASLPISESRFQTPAAVNAYLDAVEQRVHSVPAVADVALTNSLPSMGPMFGRVYQIVGRPTPAGRPWPIVSDKIVSPSYFRVIGIHLLQGRVLEPTDRFDAPTVVVINETMARTLFPGVDPLSQRLLLHRTTLQPANIPDERAYEIVGVVADEGVSWFEGQTPRAVVYSSREQDPVASYQTLVVKTTVDPATMEGAIRRAVSDVDRDQALADLEPLEQVQAENIAADRLRSLLCVAFAAVAIGLAALGLYGVLSFAVLQRTRELGIRAALGAHSSHLIALVMRQSVLLVGMGLIVGSFATAASDRVLRASLTNVGSMNAPLLGGAFCLVLVVTAMASYLPARRATRADPLVAVKAD